MNEDRSRLLSQSSSSDRQEQAHHSGDVIDVPKQLKDKMLVDLANAQKAEEDRNANHAALVVEKEQEIANSTNKIVATLTWQGDLGVEVESMKNEFKDAELWHSAAAEG